MAPLFDDQHPMGLRAGAHDDRFQHRRRAQRGIEIEPDQAGTPISQGGDAAGARGQPQKASAAGRAAGPSGQQIGLIGISRFAATIARDTLFDRDLSTATPDRDQADDEEDDSR